MLIRFFIYIDIFCVSLSQMAVLPAPADPGSGHLLGDLLGSGQTIQMAAHHVGPLTGC